jgi:hypothetical protein
MPETLLARPSAVPGSRLPMLPASNAMMGAFVGTPVGGEMSMVVT